MEMQVCWAIEGQAKLRDLLSTQSLAGVNAAFLVDMNGARMRPVRRNSGSTVRGGRAGRRVPGSARSRRSRKNHAQPRVHRAACVGLTRCSRSPALLATVAPLPTPHTHPSLQISSSKGGLVAKYYLTQAFMVDFAIRGKQGSKLRGALARPSCL